MGGPSTKHSISMGCFPNIIQAKVFAKIRCVKINLFLYYRKEHIAILSDSEAVLREVQGCIERLNGLSVCNLVHLIWVLGDKRVVGNKLADQFDHSVPAFRIVGQEPCIAMEKTALQIVERVIITSQGSKVL